MAFRNNPKMVNEGGEFKMKRWSHQEMVLDIDDTHVKISKFGRITLTRPVKGKDEYDEIEVGAGLILKLADLLKMTRKLEWVSPSELPKRNSDVEPPVNETEETKTEE